MAEPDNTEVHTVSMMSLLGEGVVFGVAATVSPVVVQRLVVGSLVEIGWYSNTTMDKGVVLLEQAWVFWLRDNLEDLEMGARCAEKAVVLLSWQQLCGFAWYWRFMCEHRLLMLQVQGTMVRVGEEWMVGRREGAGR